MNALEGLKERADRLEATIKRANRGFDPGDLSASGSRAEVKALGEYVRKGDDTSFGELKAMSVDSQPDGGYMVLPVLSNEIYRTARDLSSLRRLADVQSLTTGDAWEQIISTGRSDSAWVAEREARPVGENAKLKMIRIPLHENYANIPVTQKLLDDAGYNVGQFVLEETGLSFGEDEAVEFTTGDGVKKPRGFLTYPTSTDPDSTREWGTIQTIKTGADGAFATASATVSPADVLANAFYALRTAYRRNAVWLMNSLTAAAVRKMKDPEGRFIWRDSLQPGQMPMLLGRPVEIEENMPNHTDADALAIALADWRRAYVIVDRPGIKTIRDPFTSKPNVLFYSYVRVGGGLRDSRAIKLIQFGD
jgi:HK97 family phage major capsid protein